MTSNFDEKTIERELKIHARAVGIPSGAAEIFIEKTIKEVKKELKSKHIITDKDLQRTIAKELRKYHPDLAYVYKNHDKII